MGITVGELLDMPHLHLRLHSGSAGLVRETTWTHTSDLPQPWQWLTGGELLMTNGMSFPRRALDQVHLLEELDRAGASALAIGEEMYCPRLTRRFTETSDQLGIPVLWIRYPMPFVAISRAVAEATLLEQSQRLMRTARIYDVIRRTTTGGGDRSRVAQLIGQELRCPVFICDRLTGRSYHPSSASPPPAVSEAVRRASAEGVITAGGRSFTSSDGADVLVLEVPTHEQALLVVVREGGAALDAILLQHAATVAALELSHLHLALEHERRAGAELMAQLLEGRIQERAALDQLRVFNLEARESVAVSATAADIDQLRDLHVALWRMGIPHVVALRGDIAHGLIPSGENVVPDLMRALGPSGRLGISKPLVTASGAADAAREATWALGTTRNSTERVARYGSVSSWGGLRDVDDARALVEQWLGPLLTHDAQHHSDLVATLSSFLSNGRSWQRTASDLNVHRQTVLYRIHKVEELTNTSVSQTAHLAQFWLALEARSLLGGELAP
ncbi:PucR family transcriptional regulator ligand-binding domain-containing protein [Phycicoccus sp. MAQZ13P-2]|uniref:PucR family transcriptional regulator n=1 Tax=Phycicoccus mangrovi TaxID=2840470 RepID=UPI001C006083|nr:PucR family transcriptional regulator [Phycicoccus mangrovi]MBT9257210.1 PucR family transcriptional regulator ligand-binding domain-containing protein [Phycicoccus mangrovi]MBT9276147.1 PucR family transcriptional regulator ligand-binding domain-containing protein [Phycicoccus mangrovi]